MSITHHFADGSRPSSFGPTEVHIWDGDRGNRFRCHCGDDDDGNHYTKYEWDVKGVCLETVRLWLSKEGILEGLQYATKEYLGPFLGRPTHSEHSVKFDLPFAYPTGPALKFFFSSDKRNRRGVDFVITAVQLLNVEVRNEQKIERKWVDPEIVC